MWILWAVVAGMFLMPFYIKNQELMSRHKFDIGLFMMNRLLFTTPFALVLLLADTGLEWLAIAAGFVYGMSGIPFQIGYRYASVLVIGISGEMIPVFATLIGWLALGERMASKEITAFAAVLIGSAFAAMSGDDKRSAAKGYMILLGACAMAALYNAGTKYAKNLGGFNGFELLLMHRAGVFLAMTVLLATPLRSRMFGYFSLPKAEKLKFGRNELMFTGFAAAFATAMATQPQARSNGLVGVVYFGVLQVGLFLHGALTGKETNLVRKAIGALVAIAGLIWLATR